MGRRWKKFLSNCAPSEVRAAFIDLLTILANQFALPPLELRRAAVVTRRGAGRITGLQVADRRSRRAWGNGRFCSWAHASNHVLRRSAHKGFLAASRRRGRLARFRAGTQPALS